MSHQLLLDQANKLTEQLLLADAKVAACERQVDELAEINKELLEALKELLDAELAPYPSGELGKEAQDAWADRRATARNNAKFRIAKAEKQ